MSYICKNKNAKPKVVETRVEIIEGEGVVRPDLTFENYLFHHKRGATEREVAQRLMNSWQTSSYKIAASTIEDLVDLFSSMMISVVLYCYGLQPVQWLL